MLEEMTGYRTVADPDFEKRRAIRGPGAEPSEAERFSLSDSQHCLQLWTQRT